MSVEHIANHVELALARRTQQFLEKVNIERDLTILVEPVQRLEDVLYAVLTERDITNAEGIQLDALGKIVGEPRDGRVDDDYRRFVRARIRTNKSNGLVEDVLVVTRLVLDQPDATLQMLMYPPAGVVLNIYAEPVSDLVALTLVKFLRDVVSAGVRIIVQFFTVDESELFSLAGATAFTTGSHSPGATTVNVGDTTGFDSSGSFIMGEGTLLEETRTYTGKTATSFTGVSPLVNTHAATTPITPVDALLGFGDDTDPDVGGYFASAIE